MIYVGIDVASEKHDFFMMTDNGEVYKSSSITIANNETGYQSLCRAISEFCTTTNDENVRIGLESTGIYHQNILTYLVASGYEVELINPILTNMFAKSSKVHHPKTDNLDSQNICKFLIDHKADFKPYSLSLYNISELKSLERARFSVIEDLRKAKLHLYTLIKKIFPEYLKMFSNLYGITSLNILKKYPTPDKIVSAHDASLVSLLHGHCKCSVTDLKEAAKHSIGIYFSSSPFEIRDAIAVIEFSQNRVQGYNDEIKRIVNAEAPNLLSVPGIGTVTAGMILGEIGDISRFHSAEALVSYAGIDIETYQSGKYIATDCYISKKGSRYLRYALFQVARIAWMFDDKFKAYYNKKKAEGKHHYVIIGHLEKKIIRVIYSILKNGSTYSIDKNLTA